MIILDFFTGVFLGVFLAAAPQYWKNCTDEKMGGLADRLFSPSCACVLAAGLLKQHGEGGGGGGGGGGDGDGDGSAFSVCQIFYCRGA